jgi:uncharacterized protein YgiM (DUF1202 family)
MKKILLSFLVVCAVSLSAQNEIRYATANLNLRAYPDVSAHIITVIPEGTPVTIEENCDCAWIPVNYKDNIGYVSTKYLSKTKVKPVEYVKHINEEKVRSHVKTHPEGATALCRDGTYSFSRNRRGTCSHHGGVAQWL